MGNAARWVGDGEVSATQFALGARQIAVMPLSLFVRVVDELDNVFLVMTRANREIIATHDAEAVNALDDCKM